MHPTGVRQFRNTQGHIAKSSVAMEVTSGGSEDRPMEAHSKGPLARTSGPSLHQTKTQHMMPQLCGADQWH